MVRHWKSAADCLFLLGLLHAGAQTTPAPTPLTILVTASSPDNAPLIAGDLRVTLDRKPAQVLSLRPTKGDKLLFALLVDASGSDEPQSAAIRQAATQIFQRLSAHGDAGCLATFADSLHLSNVPASTADFQRALDGTRFLGGTSLYDSVAALSSMLRNQTYPGFPRRAIILISDGNDDNSDLSLEKLLDEVEPDEVPIYSLATPESGVEGRMGRRALKLMSTLTGGETTAPGELVAGVAPLLNALDQQWELTIAAPVAQSGKPRPLSVTTKQRHVHISATDQIEIP